MIETIALKLRNRSQKAQRSLYDFIKKTDYYSELQKDLIYGHSTIESLFYFASQFMEIRQYSPNEIIYHQSNIAEYIYVLLLGKISLKTFEYTPKSYSFEDYCLYLASIQNDDFLIQSIINQNKEIYHIRNISDIHLIPLLAIKMEIIKYAAVSDIVSITSIYSRKNIDLTYMHFNEVLADELAIDTYYDNIMMSFTEREMYYSKLINPKQKEVTILSYTPILTDDKISCFGNFKLGDNEHQLTETVSAVSPSILLLINKKLYSNCVLNDEKMMIEKEVNHLHVSYFFKGMRRKMFSEYFFYEMNLEEYPLNHILYKENDTIDKLYIIKDGSVELSFNNKSLMKIKNTINKLKSLESHVFNKEEYDDTVQLFNPMTSLIQELQQKKSFVLFKTSKTVLGEWEYYYNTNAVYTVRVASEHAKIYSMPIAYLSNKNNEDISALNYYLKEAAFNKLNGILKRMISIKKSQFEKVDLDVHSNNAWFEEEEKKGNLITDMSKINAYNDDNRSLSSRKNINHNKCNSNNPLKYSYTNLNTMNITNINKSNTDIKTIHHKKITSLFSTPNNDKSRDKKKNLNSKSKFHTKNIMSFDSNTTTPSIPLNTKQGIVMIEKKRKAMRIEQNKNTSATIDYTLPNILNYSPRSRNKKKTIPSISSLPKYTGNNTQRQINLELPKGSILSLKKSLNYLTVKKYKEYFNRVMLDSIKAKYQFKDKV